MDDVISHKSTQLCAAPSPTCDANHSASTTHHLLEKWQWFAKRACLSQPLNYASPSIGRPASQVISTARRLQQQREDSVRGRVLRPSCSCWSFLESTTLSVASSAPDTHVCLCSNLVGRMEASFCIKVKTTNHNDKILSRPIASRIIAVDLRQATIPKSVLVFAAQQQQPIAFATMGTSQATPYQSPSRILGGSHVFEKENYAMDETRGQNDSLAMARQWSSCGTSMARTGSRHSKTMA